MAISRYTNLKKLKEDKTVFLEKTKNIEIPVSSEDVWVLWRETDSVTIMSNKFYGDPQYYWVILLANNKSIEGDIKPGEKIRIPGSIHTITSNL